MNFNVIQKAGPAAAIIQGDARVLGRLFAPGTVRILTAVDLPPLVTEMTAFLPNIAASLKPGGSAWIATALDESNQKAVKEAAAALNLHLKLFEDVTPRVLQSISTGLAQGDKFHDDLLEVVEGLQQGHLRYFLIGLAKEGQGTSGTLPLEECIESAEAYISDASVYSDSEDDDEGDSHPNYYRWQTVYPFLELLRQNMDVLRAEVDAASDWRDWPEKNLYYRDGEQWTVMPFLHTFPAVDPSKSVWVSHFCQMCPKTVALLRKIPGIRTALFSRMGPHTRLAAHRGWADLSNHVLRCHLALRVPGEKACGLWVRGEVRYHRDGEFILFDDSKLHKAFNESDEERIVLIFDIARPDWVPAGTAKKGHTDDLDDFIAYFR